MPSTLVVLATLLSAPSYASVSDSAHRIDNLGRFLEGYVGRCNDNPKTAAAQRTAERRACKSAVDRFRTTWRGKPLRVEVDDPGQVLSVVGFDKRKGAFRLNLVPFFAARGLGLSVGRPRHFNADGEPVMRHLPVWVRLPKDTPAFVFRRNLERGMVGLELVVVPRKAYRLPRRGRAPVEGLDVKLRGVRLVDARSGDTLAEQTYQR